MGMSILKKRSHEKRRYKGYDEGRKPKHDVRTRTAETVWSCEVKGTGMCGKESDGIAAPRN